jgi:acyl-CoA reductase-like NAD-dependent aldehyde dehydrogenase
VGIVPWNFPVFLACGKIAQAVLTGNPIIIKPSPFTPYCSLKIVELAQRFFPPGVVQALSGDDDLGPWLTSHPGIRKISFTGSTTIGKKVMESASKTLKRVTLELYVFTKLVILWNLTSLQWWKRCGNRLP